MIEPSPGMHCELCGSRWQMSEARSCPVCEPQAGAPVQDKKHSHYFKRVAHLEFVDVYRVLDLYGVHDPCLQHAAKKVLVAGGRGAGKDIRRDIQEAIDTLQRKLAMLDEDEGATK